MSDKNSKNITQVNVRANASLLEKIDFLVVEMRGENLIPSLNRSEMIRTLIELSYKKRIKNLSA